MTTPRVCVYIASSLDGFIAGPDDDLSWLTGGEAGEATGSGGQALDVSDPGALHYDEFIAGIGVLLMGRGTYDVVRGFDGPWHYGDLPILVATHRPLDPDPPETVRAVTGSIEELVSQAKEAAGDLDVYLDGGVLIRQAAEAGLIDHLVVTLAPIALGAGHPLFAGLSARYPLEIVAHYTYRGRMVQLHMRPR